MSKPLDPASVLSRLIARAMTTWTGTFRLAIILAAAAAGPAATVV